MATRLTQSKTSVSRGLYRIWAFSSGSEYFSVEVATTNRYAQQLDRRPVVILDTLFWQPSDRYRTERPTHPRTPNTPDRDRPSRPTTAPAPEQTQPRKGSPPADSTIADHAGYPLETISPSSDPDPRDRRPCTCTGPLPPQVKKSPGSGHATLRFLRLPSTESQSHLNRNVLRRSRSRDGVAGTPSQATAAPPWPGVQSRSSGMDRKVVSPATAASPSRPPLPISRLPEPV
jgi:hypothetical protein